MSRLWWILGAAAFLLWVFRRPLEQLYAQRIMGLEAAADAATINTYTTYNTQIYSEPVWTPLLRFFKANAYRPAARSDRGGEAGGQEMSYSVQG
jgi:hypothetical protein